jgi:ABC-type Fe3+/spermidine/putrescine transport system ATPase subunit
MTFVYVTHDQTEAITMSDRIAVMKDGVVHQVGTPEEIYCNPSTAFVASFIGDMNFMEGSIREVREDTVLIDLSGEEIVSNKGPYEFRKDEKILLCIRPEKVCMGDEYQCENEIQVELIRIVFRGNDYEVWMDVNGTGLRAVVDCKYWDESHEPGDAVTVKWLAGDSIIFPIGMKDALINYSMTD